MSDLRMALRMATALVREQLLDGDRKKDSVYVHKPESDADNEQIDITITEPLPGCEGESYWRIKLEQCL